MVKANWKGPTLNKKDLTFTNTNISERNEEIMPKHINTSTLVHNGKKNMLVNVTKEMVGHKFGEFSFTRKSYYYKKK